MAQLRDVSPKEWIWHLFQNAIDGRKVNKRNDISIVFEPEQLKFSHHGRCFESREVYNLVLQDSNKRWETRPNQPLNQIGRRGTGFMCTHTLSHKVDVEIYVNDTLGYETCRRFNFTIDRSSPLKGKYPGFGPVYFPAKSDGTVDQTSDDWTRHFSKLLYQFLPIMENLHFWKGKFLETNLEPKTCFTYKLIGAVPQQVAKLGIESFKKNACFALLVNQGAINFVTINENVYSLEKREISNFVANVKFASLRIESRDVQQSTCAETLAGILYMTMNETMVGLHVTFQDETWKKLSVQPPSNEAKIWYHTPVFGSEVFGTAFICHSKNFKNQPMIDSETISETFTDYVEMIKTLSTNVARVLEENDDMESFENLTTCYPCNNIGCEFLFNYNIYRKNVYEPLKSFFDSLK